MDTDFSTWDRATLERFAREVADENKQLREDVQMLLKQLRESYTAEKSS